MKIKFLAILCATALFTGCTSTSEEAVTTSDTAVSGPMADCNLPTLKDDRGPIRPTMFVVGSFDEAYWMHLPERAMEYKGDGIYQLVRNEKKQAISFQVAAMNWKPQFTAEGKTLNVGQLKSLKKGGFVKDTVIKIPEDGKYVWSIKVGADKTPQSIFVGKCKK